METPVCIDLERLAQRSTGVFGQSGTGKSVLTRLLLCGIIRNKTAGVLIFDMHGEYADGQRAEEAGGRIAGLRDVFGSSRIVTYTIDERLRGADFQLQIGLNQIETDDIALLAEELALRDTFEATTSALRERFGDRLAGAAAGADRQGGGPGVLRADRRQPDGAGGAAQQAAAAQPERTPLSRRDRAASTASTACSTRSGRAATSSSSSAGATRCSTTSSSPTSSPAASISATSTWSRPTRRRATRPTAPGRW